MVVAILVYKATNDPVAYGSRCVAQNKQIKAHLVQCLGILMRSTVS